MFHVASQTTDADTDSIYAIVSVDRQFVCDGVFYTRYYWNDGGHTLFHFHGTLSSVSTFNAYISLSRYCYQFCGFRVLALWRDKTWGFAIWGVWWLQ